MEYIKKHINKEFIITGDPQHQERWQYPLLALREIVINMIVHRDYRSQGHSIIKIFKDHIEFYNPGQPYGDITVDKLLSGEYKSEIRNKKVASVFKEAGVIEQYGSGITRILRAFEEYGSMAPEFKVIQKGLNVTVWAIDVESKSEANGTVNGTVNNNIVKLLDENHSITAKELSESLGISIRTIRRMLKELQETGIIKRVGSDKKGHWIVLKKEGIQH